MNRVESFLLGVLAGYAVSVAAIRNLSRSGPIVEPEPEAPEPVESEAPYGVVFPTETGLLELDSKFPFVGAVWDPFEWELVESEEDEE